MTLASALAVTRPGACCEDADRLARDRHVEHLLVVERLRLIGVVTRRDLRLGGLVRERMSREVFALFSDATLGEALGAMVELRVGFLPVIGERFVIGAVTRTDLARVGVPAHLFAA
jgi:CBS domain-containing protein